MDQIKAIRAKLKQAYEYLGPTDFFLVVTLVPLFTIAFVVILVLMLLALCRSC